MNYPKIWLTLNLLPVQSSCQTLSKVRQSFRSLRKVRSCCLFLFNDPLLTEFCENTAQTAEANCSHEDHVQHCNFDHVHDSQFDEVPLFVFFLALISSSQSARNNHPSNHTNKHCNPKRLNSKLKQSKKEFKISNPIPHDTHCFVLHQKQFHHPVTPFKLRRNIMKKVLCVILIGTHPSWMVTTVLEWRGDQFDLGGDSGLR